MSTTQSEYIIIDATSVTDEVMLAYLNNKLSASQQLQVQQIIENDPFLMDAFEGLKQFQQTKDVEHIADLINYNIKSKLKNNKQRREPFFISKNNIFVPIIIILLIIITVLFFVKILPLLT